MDHLEPPESEEPPTTLTSIQIPIPTITAEGVTNAIAQMWLRGIQADCGREDGKTNLTKMVMKLVREEAGKAISAVIETSVTATIEKMLADGWTVTDEYGGASKRVTVVDIAVRHLTTKRNYSGPTRLDELVSETIEKAVKASFEKDGMFAAVMADAKAKLVDSINTRLVADLRRVMTEALGRLA